MNFLTIAWLSSPLVLAGMGLILGLLVMVADAQWWRVWYQEPQQNSPVITRSLFFLVAFFPLGLFVLTSTGSWIGIGVILGIGSVLAIEAAAYRHNLVGFQQHFLGDTHRLWTTAELTRLMYGIVGGVLGLWLLAAMLLVSSL